MTPNSRVANEMRHAIRFLAVQDTLRLMRGIKLDTVAEKTRSTGLVEHSMAPFRQLGPNKAT